MPLPLTPRIESPPISSVLFDYHKGALYYVAPRTRCRALHMWQGCVLVAELVLIVGVPPLFWFRAENDRGASIWSLRIICPSRASCIALWTFRVALAGIPILTGLAWWNVYQMGRFRYTHRMATRTYRYALRAQWGHLANTAYSLFLWATLVFLVAPLVSMDGSRGFLTGIFSNGFLGPATLLSLPVCAAVNFVNMFILAALHHTHRRWAEFAEQFETLIVSSK